MQIFAHRGASGTEPENTMRAFRAAAASGANGVELDARATADGTIVVIHDGDVGRTTDGSGRVDDLSLQDLRALDAGDGEPIPTLTEVVALLAGRLTIDIELKQPAIVEPVLKVLAGFPSSDWFISCFDWQELRRVKKMQPAVAVWPLAMTADDALFAVARELGAPGVALHFEAYTPEVARMCDHAGLAVGVWTVNDPAAARLARDLGAAVLMTDFPAAMRAALAAS